MQVEKIELLNFKGARSLQILLRSDINVLIGENGSGKSTVLNVLAILLSWAVSRIKSINASGRTIDELEISNHTSNSTLEITCKHDNTDLTWKVHKVRKGHPTGDDKSNFNSLNDFVKTIQSQFENSEGKINLPLVVYYPVNRAVLDIPLRIRSKHTFEIFSAYDDALKGGVEFRKFFEWFREREDFENEVRSISHPDINNANHLIFDGQLDCVRRAISEFMPDFQNLRVRRNPLRMEVEKNGEVFWIDQLSDGEKVQIAMIGDLARRLAIANPTLDDPLEGKGIVLIDEVDLHLHPKWQKTVLNNLKRVFKSCQFIVSTHSPHVVTHVDPESVYKLNATPNGLEVSHPESSYGKTVERVLLEIMDLETTRPEQVQLDLNKIFELIDANNLDQAKTMLEAAKEKIKEDADLVKADILLRRKEALNK